MFTDGVLKVQPSTRPGIEPRAFWLAVRDLTNCTNLPHSESDLDLWRYKIGWIGDLVLSLN